MEPANSLFSQAVASHQAGDLPKAEQLYLDILKQNDRHIDALYLLGTLYLSTRRLDLAQQHLSKALSLRPNDPDLLLNWGLAQRNLGRPDEALKCYQQALSLAPHEPKIHNNIGSLLSDLGRYGEAVPFYLKALELNPTYVEARFNLANIFRMEGRLTEAAALYKRALKDNPDYDNAKVNLGIVLCALGHYQEATSVLADALKNRPDDLQILNNLGNAWRLLGDADQAIALYEKALHLKPDYVDAMANLGTAYRDKERLDEATASFQVAQNLAPNNIAPHVGLGVLAMDSGDPAKAVTHFEKALSLHPASIEAGWNLSLALLALGKLDQAWPYYERGLGVRGLRGPLPFKDRRWNGDPFPGKRLLLWAEQGFGDSLQFIRYARLCKERGGDVIVQCPEPLASLFKNTQGIDEIVTNFTDVAFDHQISLMSLPGIFNTTLETIPANIPYLAAGKIAREKVAPKLTTIFGLKVGLVWAGKARPEQVNAHLYDKRRSLSLEQLKPLFDIPGVTFFNLQIGPAAAQISDLGLGNKIIDLTADIKNFEDTAALIEKLDLVISVDTSVVHLAGGLGKPVWILSRKDACWRWLQNQETNPWYPTARVFGQTTFGDWDNVIDRVKTNLLALTNPPPASQIP